MRGSIALPKNLSVGATSFIRFMVDGREAVTKFVDLGGPRFEAVVDCPRLSLTEHFDDLMDDPAYDDVRGVLLARFERACALAARHIEHGDPRSRDLRPHLLDLLLARAPAPPMDVVIESYPLFPLVTGRTATLAELRRDVAEFGATYLIFAPSPGPQLDHRCIVVDIEEKRLRKVLGKVFGAKKVVDYTRRLGDEREALRKMQGPAEALVLPDALLATDFAVGDIRGVVGLMRPGSTARPIDTNTGPRNMTRRPAVVGFFKDGKRIETRETVLKAGPIEALIESPRFTTTPSWDAVRNDDGMKEAMAALEQGIRALAVHAAAALPTLKTWGRTLALQVLVDYVAWKPTELPEPVERAWILSAIDGRMLSVLELRDEVARCDNLFVVFAQPAASEDETGRPVLLLDTDEKQRAMRALFPGVRLVDRKRDLAVFSGRRAFLKRPQQVASLSGDLLRFTMRAPLSDLGLQGWSGEFGLLGPEQPDGKGVWVTVLREGREIDRIQVPAPLAAEALVSWDKAPVNETWSALASESAVQELQGVVSRAVEAAVSALLDRDVRPDTPRAALLLRYACRLARSASDFERGPDLLKRVAVAPVLEDSTGAPLSLATLVTEYKTFKSLHWVSVGVEGRPLEARHVLRCDEGVLEQMSPLFPCLQNAEAALCAARVGRRNFEQAPRVTSMRLEDGPWLARVAATGGGLQGELAVSSTPGARVEMVVEGRIVERRVLFPGLSIAGVLTSASFKASDAWDEVLLKPQHERALEKLLDTLYEQVARIALEDASARASLLQFYLARREVLKLEGATLPGAARAPVLPQAGGGHLSLQTALDVWRSEPPPLPAGWTSWVQERVVKALTTDFITGEGRAKDRFVYVAHAPVEWPHPVLDARDRTLLGFLEDFFGLRSVCRIDERSATAVANEKAREADEERRRNEEALQSAANRRETEARQQLRLAEERAREQAARERASEAEADLRRRQAEARRLTPDEMALQQALANAFTRLCARMEAKWRDRLAKVRVVRGADSRWVTFDEKGLVDVAADHPVTRLAIDRCNSDRGALACLVSAVYTAVNQWESGVTDDDEVHFMEDLTDWLLEAEKTDAR